MILFRTIVVSVLFLCALCIGASAQNKTIVQQNDWAKTLRYEKDNCSLAKRPFAVFMGNSITDHWSNRIHPEFFKEHNFVGRGISGQTSAEMLVRFRKDVLELKPEVVVINAGTNDIAMNNGYISHENIMRNIISMCELAKANHIRVVLCSVLPASQFRWMPEIDPRNKIVELNKLIKLFADKNNIVYVDYHTMMKDENNGLQNNLTEDGCHPVMAGYEIMEQLILKGINEACSR